MYQNKNAGNIPELARDERRVHRVRNRIAILAIILTSLFLISIFTAVRSIAHGYSVFTDAALHPGFEGVTSAAGEETGIRQGTECCSSLHNSSRCACQQT